MLFSVNPRSRVAQKEQPGHLQSVGLHEQALQDIFFNSLDRLFSNHELLLLMQSQSWQQEPDLMAVDRDGNLYIFELMACKSNSSSPPELRYRRYGTSKYCDLDAWYQIASGLDQSLRAAHRAKFDVEIREDDFNRKQVFVVIANGLDYRTREAIQCWRTSGLDVRPWIYRVYRGRAAEPLLEVSPFGLQEDPCEDLEQSHYVLNTNSRGSREDHEDMLLNA